MSKNNKVGKRGLPTSNAHKDKHFIAQMQEVFAEFRREPQTMKQVEVITGIDRANICRYVRVWRLAGRIAKFKRVYCPITHHEAFKLTTDPELFPSPAPTLFDDQGGPAV